MTKTGLVLLAVLLASPAVQAGSKKSKATGAVTRSESCRLRFDALCSVMQKCVANADDLGGARCEAIDPGCDEQYGEAVYTRTAVDACVAGLVGFKCSKKIDPNDSRSMDFESKVSACKALVSADSAQDKRGALREARASK
jgi:hypothetical protein